MDLIVIRVTMPLVGAGTVANAGPADVALSERCTRPYDRPTQTMSELAGATAMALI